MGCNEQSSLNKTKGNLHAFLLFNHAMFPTEQGRRNLKSELSSFFTATSFLLQSIVKRCNLRCGIKFSGFFLDAEKVARITRDRNSVTNINK